MNQQCPQCGADMKVIPAGISRKTGKPYKAFSVCETPECKEKKEEWKRRKQSDREDAALDKRADEIGEILETIDKIRVAFAGLKKDVDSFKPIRDALIGAGILTEEGVLLHESFRIQPLRDIKVSNEEIPTITPDVIEKAFPGSKWQ